MAKAVQFRNRDQVEKAFSNLKIECWSIWNDKQLLTKGCGEDMLCEFLDLLENGSSQAIYTIRFYEDISDAKLIKEKTPADGSFNFILKELVNGSDYFREDNKKNRLFERLGAIEEKLFAEDEPEKETIGSVFMGLLKEPAQLAQMIDIGRSLMGMKPIYDQPAYQQLPANTIGGIPATSEEKIHRVQMALETLERNDVDLLIHLEKLAKISETSKGMFKMLLTTLDNFK